MTPQSKVDTQQMDPAHELLQVHRLCTKRALCELPKAGLLLLSRVCSSADYAAAPHQLGTSLQCLQVCRPHCPTSCASSGWLLKQEQCPTCTYTSNSQICGHTGLAPWCKQLWCWQGHQRTALLWLQSVASCDVWLGGVISSIHCMQSSYKLTPVLAEHTSSSPGVDMSPQRNAECTVCCKSIEVFTCSAMAMTSPLSASC